MAIPTRLDVLLHNRKSAAAGTADAMSPASAKSASEMILNRVVMRAPRFCLDSGSIDEDGTKIVDVGIGWPRPKQVAQPREKPPGIVVRKKEGGIEAERPSALSAVGGHERPRRVVRFPRPAIGAIGIAGYGRKP